ncbi:hypothetical protein MNBD_GAMMA09-1521 [hydrothermal vent metagenome]|uniref:Coenzyme Q-binding protein COQ10 START domain-containing protein n=1 Tax=hydrothermal vent metagenome TaxID=652676 RepID=A0A3B0XCL5_9ZZZZ
MKRSIIIFLLLSSFIGGIYWYGSKIPRESTTSVSQAFNRSEKDIRELILNYKLYPRWRENVYEVTEVPSRNEHPAWKETNENGKTTPFQLLSFQNEGNASEITIEISGKELNTLGRWHFKIVGHEGGLASTLTITEDKLIPNLLARVIKQLRSHGTEHIDSYFRSINNKFIGDVMRKKRAKQLLDSLETSSSQPPAAADAPPAQQPAPSQGADKKPLQAIKTNTH